MTSRPLTSREAGLLACATCGLLSRPATPLKAGYCPRCGYKLSLRRHHAIQYTWALIIAAAICYIPANILPVLTRVTLVYTKGDTIIDGIVALYAEGSWHLALIVLIASIIIPMAKLIALAYLLIIVRSRSSGSNLDRTRLYRLIDFVGRWSMLDVFVVTLAVALVQIQPFVLAKPGPGVPFFAAVVVLTMLAAKTFDPRLIWDSDTEKEEPHARKS
ncbi:MAG TPA: paraquat-inducible protein A [Syntrophales bacterium]|jgi:paraquat-inducible protein A|nr:paraquat-inducible protein A [Syntrophales bacterium]HQA83455.1 paraquat-inducible protein A [Syntrophales bacterium]